MIFLKVDSLYPTSQRVHRSPSTQKTWQIVKGMLVVLLGAEAMFCYSLYLRIWNSQKH